MTHRYVPPKKKTEVPAGRKRCNRCGSDSHTTTEHVAEQKKLEVKKNIVLKPRSTGVTNAALFGVKFGVGKEKLYQLAKQDLHDIHLTKPPKPVLTKRARRQAKKRFLKKQHSLMGYIRREYSAPVPDQKVVRYQQMINEHAQKLFKKNYFNLTSQQQTKVFESLNSKDEKTQWQGTKEPVN